MKMSLQELSPEILIKIFQYCDVRELYQLQKTCFKFCEIIKTATSLGNTVPLLVTNQLRREMRNRTLRLLPLREKCRISYNWKNGVYHERHVLKERKKYIPCLALTRDHVWISKGSRIHAYKRNFSIDVHKASYSIDSTNTADVCKFVYKQNCIVSGQQDGSIRVWKSNNDFIHTENCHESDIHSVDIDGNILVSGSKDNSVKIWSLRNELREPAKHLHTYALNNRVWSTSLCSGGQYLAVGTAGLHSVPPLHIFDLNRSSIHQEFRHDFRNGSGILQIKWESPCILLSCGYDKNIRKWDMRTGTCVQSWEDPFYATIYCFDTDNCYTVLTGTESNGRVVLWDMRTNNYVQMYLMETCKRLMFSSPVYSLSFDVFHLFAATDRCLNVLDFSVKNGSIRNYRNIFAASVSVEMFS